MKNELIPVNITVGDRTYRIKTNPSDEEVVRNTVKLINDKVVEFKTQFAGKDMQDYIAMVIIWYATQQASENMNAVELSRLSEKLDQLEKQLSQFD
jgi:cell division protein ZapA (FtsZ GTPase activity inhibitor)